MRSNHVDWPEATALPLPNSVRQAKEGFDCWNQRLHELRGSAAILPGAICLCRASVCGRTHGGHHVAFVKSRFVPIGAEPLVQAVARSDQWRRRPLCS
jgi:hypothetical protein